MTAPEEELGDRLRSLADRAGPPTADGPGLARAVAERSESRRRTRRNLLAAAGCLVLVGIAVPRLGDLSPEKAVSSGDVSSGDASSGGASSGGASSGVSSSAAPGGPPFTRVPTVDIADLTTRGSLSDDQAFLDGVRALDWTEEAPVRAADGTILYYQPDPPVEAREVVFAGDVPGGRWALVAGRTSPVGANVPEDVVPHDELVAAWFTGPPGAAPEQMVLASGPNGIAGDWPVALTDPRTGVVVVVAAPGDVVEVSTRPLIGADGSTSREWREVDTENGVAIARVPPFPRAADGSTSYRVLRGGRLEARDMPWSVVVEGAGEPPAIAYPRGRPAELGQQAAEYSAEYVLAELGLSGMQTTVAAQWVGPVPTDGPGVAALVTVTLPSGAIVVQAQWLMPEDPDGSSMGTYCGRAILPAGPPVERRVHAVACEVFDTTSGHPVSTHLVVVGPPEVALIRTYDDDRVFLGEHTAQDGVVVAPLPLGTDQVEAVTAGGVTLGRVDLMGQTVDFGD
ncbi:hypothetical protein [Blastococcus haudaquaticus]|uniref:Uncharacterized protein n=1 Tax=Blastococcus haudaquaticus TaxID=1938745 RepID=A0A286GU48_9ACTN|nr:hypothetical protein [Blastococcus haudaquaticus]SOD99097.1 hypothetical protein SAMN06272739_2167 [Blastococcus haudaquaticus]